MDAVLEQWYEKTLDEEIQRNFTGFLDNFELDLAKKISRQYNARTHTAHSWSGCQCIIHRIALCRPFASTKRESKSLLCLLIFASNYI